MSHPRVCLVLLLILGVTIRFSNSEGLCEESERHAPGSDKTTLSLLEKTAKGITKPLHIAEDALKKGKDLFDKIWKKPKNDAEPKEKKSFGSFMNLISKYLPQAIAPGTHWCGAGNNAKNEDDLGIFKDTDACCRAHDNCKFNIESGGTKANLLNNALFTRSACTCDYEFYDCLKKAKSVVSYKIGTTYFNVLGPQCFECQCPTEGCNINEDPSRCLGHCSQYVWKNNRKFLGLPGRNSSSH